MQTILVTDTQKALGLNLAKAFLQRGCRVIAAPSEEPGGGARKKGQESLKHKSLDTVAWNRSSPLSAKNLILQSLQLGNGLDAALILLPPLPPSAPFAEIKYLDVETTLDVWLKGSILLARDLLAHFASRRGGSLSFVNLSHPKSEGASLLDDLCREGMLVVWDGLVKAGKESGVKVNAFLSRSPDAKAYADYIALTTAEKCNRQSGKLFYFQWK